MQKEEIRKLWFHTIIFVVLISLIVPIFRSLDPGVGIINGMFRAAVLMLLCSVLVCYPRFMIRWFRQMQAEGKPGDWEFLIRRWTRILWFGIILSLAIIIFVIVDFLIFIITF